MQLNDAGISLIKEFEGCNLSAYPDPGTGGEPITIGWGATGGVKLGDRWTQQQADDRLAQDLHKVSTQVLPLLGNVTLTDNQFSALVSFAYNCGVFNLAQSSLLRAILAHEFENAADEFLKWNKAAGHILTGLNLRRSAERDLFLK